MDKENRPDNKAGDSTQAQWGNLIQGQWNPASHGPYNPQGPLGGYALTSGSMVPNPTSLSSLAIGVLNRGESAWLLQYIESEIFKSTLGKIKERTKIDVVVLLAAGLALQKAKKSIPELLVSLLDRFKQQATSSMRIGIEDSTKYNGILRLSAEKKSSDCSSWLKFGLRGQHHSLNRDGTITPRYGKADRFFWHKKTLFSLEVFGPEQYRDDSNDDNDHENKSDIRFNHGYYIQEEHLIVRCFGNSRSPIEQLLKDVEDRFVKSEKLSVTKIVANENPESMQREKRALATIDMEPEKLEAIREDVEAFFDKHTRVLCRDTGTPYRRGYLLHGPPGTGKSSLSVAIPSHANVTLVTITLHGMDDKMLEKAFSNLPYRCVVLIEDIDCAGAEVGKRDDQPGQVFLSEDGGDAKIDADTALNSIENAMERFLLQQNQHNEEMLQRFTDTFQRQEPQTYQRRDTIQAKLPEHPRKVTLSGLLNVIDGATAAEGRLLIMTTNHPESLDKALLRKGRVDRHFEIGYATKITAELTFNRIFGQDTHKRHTMAAINRFAKAFSAQFPTHSEVTTATLAHYCMQYQRRPCEAVRDFGRYLELGDDMWVYSIPKPQHIPRDRINVPEAFDQKMLEVGSADCCREDAIPKGLATGGSQAARSLWRPWTWSCGITVAGESQSPPVKEPNEEAEKAGRSGVSFIGRGPVDMATVSLSMISERRQQCIQAYVRRCGLVSQGRSPADGEAQAVSDEVFEFCDEDFNDSENTVSLRSASPRPIPQDSSSSSSSGSSKTACCSSGEATPRSKSSDDSVATPMMDVNSGNTSEEEDSEEEDEEEVFDALEYQFRW
ncbi:hypothetical protein PTNB73_01331 [Pyrenophora teres f. teres]|nr:hypothetical protein HRS9122_02602 [Pyrenophora teres f. teres]KAE8874699.1 hypothetical protein PTNB73_01331 [Pyrenophora teres f. teres]